MSRSIGDRDFKGFTKRRIEEGTDGVVPQEVTPEIMGFDHYCFSFFRQNCPSNEKTDFRQYFQREGKTALFTYVTSCSSKTYYGTVYGTVGSSTEILRHLIHS